MFKGGCRCGEIQYESRKPPSDITICHCRSCQQLSGSAYLPFTDTSASAVTFIKDSTRTTLRLSPSANRTFCSSCGTPISISYGADAGRICLTVASIDLTTMISEIPPLRVARHVYLKEKAPWVVLPEDDSERWGTMEHAHLLL